MPKTLRAFFVVNWVAAFPQACRGELTRLSDLRPVLRGISAGGLLYNAQGSLT